jgi:hypothetical protein
VELDMNQPKYWRISNPRSETANRAALSAGDVDCTSFFPANVGRAAIHGAYFVTDATIELMRQILRGIDRGVLDQLGVTKGSAWPV